MRNEEVWNCEWEHLSLRGDEFGCMRFVGHGEQDQDKKATKGRPVCTCVCAHFCSIAPPCRMWVVSLSTRNSCTASCCGFRNYSSVTTMDSCPSMCLRWLRETDLPARLHHCPCVCRTYFCTTAAGLRFHCSSWGCDCGKAWTSSPPHIHRPLVPSDQ